MTICARSGTSAALGPYSFERLRVNIRDHLNMEKIFGTYYYKQCVILKKFSEVIKEKPTEKLSQSKEDINAAVTEINSQIALIDNHFKNTPVIN